MRDVTIRLTDREFEVIEKRLLAKYDKVSKIDKDTAAILCFSLTSMIRLYLLEKIYGEEDND